MKSFIFAYFLCGLTAISLANDELQNNDSHDGLGRMPNGVISYGANMPLYNEKPVINPDTLVIKEKIEEVNDKLLDLEVAIELGVDNYNFKRDVNDLRREILRQDFAINYNDPGTEESRWNESELMILEAKKQLDYLNDKIKLQGDWGKVGLKLDEAEQYQKIDLKYKFGF